MKLNYAPQAGLRRRRADNRREVIAFWAGILIVVAFEGVLMAKSWSPMSSESIFAFSTDRQDADAEAGD
jgi:hypothetical protein